MPWMQPLVFGPRCIKQLVTTFTHYSALPGINHFVPMIIIFRMCNNCFLISRQSKRIPIMIHVQGGPIHKYSIEMLPGQLAGAQNEKCVFYENNEDIDSDLSAYLRSVSVWWKKKCRIHLHKFEFHPNECGFLRFLEWNPLIRMQFVVTCFNAGARCDIQRNCAPNYDLSCETPPD